MDRVQQRKGDRLPAAPAIALIVCALMLFAPVAHAQSIRVGTMGDSLTDEYAEGNYNYALNWVQQLVIFRGIDFGPTAAQAGQAGGTWGEPRRTQYEFNWARSGADSVDLIAQGQHTGLAAQIVPQEISHALLAIGANDFAPVPLPGFAYFHIYWNSWSQSQIQNYINNVAGRIATAMDTLLAHDVHFILASVPDYGVTPIAQSFFSNPDRRENVTVVINALNEIIEDMAAEREVVLLDMAGLATAIFGTNHDLNDVLLLGNVEIYLGENDTNTNTNPQAAFVHDNIHPHTTLQGLFANVILEAINVGTGTSFDLFTEVEILSHAGLAYGGADTLADQLGAFSDYVIDFTPPAVPGDLNGDGIVNVTDLLLLLGAWGDCPPPQDASCPGDLNGDGAVNVSDLLLLLANWG